MSDGTHVYDFSLYVSRTRHRQGTGSGDLRQGPFGLLDRRLRRPKLARWCIPSVCLRRLRSAYTEPAIAWVSSTMLAMVEGKALLARPAMSPDTVTKRRTLSLS